MSSTSSSSIASLTTISSASILRLQSLYSDFTRQKTSNPTGYHSNVHWWRQTLEDFVWQGLQRDGPQSNEQHSGHLNDRLVLHAGPSLVNAMRLNGVGKPIGLGTVITELSQPSSSSSKSSLPSLLPLPSFLTMSDSIYKAYARSLPIRVASYLVTMPLWWGLEQLGIIGEDGILHSLSWRSNTSWHGDYVVVSSVEKAGQNVLAHRRLHDHGGPGDTLYTMESFRRTFAGCVGTGGVTPPQLTEADASVLLRYLERDKGATVVDKDKDVIKFVDQDASDVARSITPIDIGILELKTAVDHLHTQATGIQRKIDQCTEKASSALKQKHKSLALTYLKSRKQLEDLLKKRLGSLNNLESTLLRVEASAGDIKIMEAFQSSTATLRSILSHPSLQRESIEQTMEALAEANADAREIDDTIRISGDGAIGIEDADVEDELAELVREAEAEKTATEVEDKIGQAPTAPATVPVSPISELEPRVPTAVPEI